VKKFANILSVVAAILMVAAVSVFASARANASSVFSTRAAVLRSASLRDLPAFDRVPTLPVDDTMEEMMLMIPSTRRMHTIHSEDL